MVKALGADFIGVPGSGTQYEPLRRHNWEVQVDQFDTKLPARTCTVPRMEFERFEIFHYNERTKGATKPNANDIRIELLDVIEPQIMQQLWAWWLHHYNPGTGAMGYMSEYKRQVQITQNDVKGNLIRTYTCKGCFLLQQPFPEEALDYSSGEPVNITLNLSVDKVTIDTVSSSGNGTTNSNSGQIVFS